MGTERNTTQNRIEREFHFIPPKLDNQAVVALELGKMGIEADQGAFVPIQYVTAEDLLVIIAKQLEKVVDDSSHLRIIFFPPLNEQGASTDQKHYKPEQLLITPHQFRCEIPALKELMIDFGLLPRSDALPSAQRLLTEATIDPSKDLKSRGLFFDYIPRHPGKSRDAALLLRGLNRDRSLKNWANISKHNGGEPGYYGPDRFVKFYPDDTTDTISALDAVIKTTNNDTLICIHACKDDNSFPKHWVVDREGLIKLRERMCGSQDKEGFFSILDMSENNNKPALPPSRKQIER